ncbi:MAG: bacillithiol biosynthesis cysteine-adding enzyme BshC, partial [Deltaproteobacteria bacterium]
MTVRIAGTPLDAGFLPPEPRAGGFDPALLPAIVTAPGHEALRARLEQPGVLVVTTGQQPALFTGPLYHIHKALSAAALAELLERRWSRPVVPLFWVAGDDHDFAEASHAEWLGADGAVSGAALPARPPDAPLTPMYREPLGPAVIEALAALERDVPPSDFRDATLGWIRRHFRPEATVAASYAGALAELLAPFGVLVFDSTHSAMKRAATPLLLRALGLAEAIEADLAAQADALSAAGTDSGMHIGVGATLVMLECRLGRDRLIRHGGGFSTRRGKAEYSLAELEALAAREPTRFSPNVLLRPVVESALLPTVAYLGGPGELRYLGLTPPLYRRMGVAPQRPLPRWSGVLVETRVDRVLEKFGVELGELMQPPGPLEARIVRSRLPESGVAALAALRAAIESGYATIGRAAVEVDPTLEKPVQGARNQALAGTQEVEKKLLHHLKKRQETELAQLARARTAVWPHGK